MAKLETDPVLREESVTIGILVGIYCRAHHGKDLRGGDGLCEDCRTFLAYARKRLACCPYGAEKPDCGHCKIHCYRPAEREKAREIMRFAGPRLLWRHPILAWRHMKKTLKPAPAKPRNRAANTSSKK